MQTYTITFTIVLRIHLSMIISKNVQCELGQQMFNISNPTKILCIENDRRRFIDEFDVKTHTQNPSSIRFDTSEKLSSTEFSAHADRQPKYHLCANSFLLERIQLQRGCSLGINLHFLTVRLFYGKHTFTHFHSKSLLHKHKHIYMHERR